MVKVKVEKKGLFVEMKKKKIIIKQKELFDNFKFCLKVIQFEEGGNRHFIYISEKEEIFAIAAYEKEGSVLKIKSFVTVNYYKYNDFENEIEYKDKLISKELFEEYKSGLKDLGYRFLKEIIINYCKRQKIEKIIIVRPYTDKINYWIKIFEKLYKNGVISKFDRNKVIMIGKINGCNMYIEREKLNQLIQEYQLISNLYLEFNI